MATHDLRKPAGTIISFSEFLRDEASAQLSGEQQRFLDIIHHAGTSISKIIDDFLDLAIIESGRLEIYAEPADLGGLLQNSLRTLRLIAEKKKIMLKSACSSRFCV